MQFKISKLVAILTILIIAGIVLSACSSAQTTPTVSVEPVEEDHEAEEADHDDEAEHEEGGLEVPHEAAEVPNPIAASDESLAIGAGLYENNCAVCHGESGEGDGPAGSALAIPPPDLHEDHVQSLTDGALFYIISHSEPGSPMPAWEDVLDEDERWHVVNFLRTFME